MGLQMGCDWGASVKHKLITIGWLGGKRAYLDVSREEAIRRYTEAEGNEPDEQHIEEFEFVDEFYTYEAGPLR